MRATFPAKDMAIGLMDAIELKYCKYIVFFFFLVTLHADDVEGCHPNWRLAKPNRPSRDAISLGEWQKGNAIGPIFLSCTRRMASMIPSAAEILSGGNIRTYLKNYSGPLVYNWKGRYM